MKDMLRRRMMLALLAGGLWVLAGPAPAADVKIVEGKIGPGSMYALLVPADWNGGLVLYAHGYVNPALPVSLPIPTGIEEPFRDGMLDLGYAVAYSSYSETGWSVADGVRRTRQLQGIFRSKFGVPKRTYLVAHSMGTVVAAKLGEAQGNRYDGMLLLCGALGGLEAEINYLADVRVLLDLFYPGILPGNVMNIPPGLDFVADYQNPLIGAIIANPSGAGIISQLYQTPVPFASTDELGSSLITAVYFNFLGFNDLTDRAHGHSIYGNADVEYSSASVSAPVLDLINAGVERYEAAPDAVNYIQHNYTPTGEIELPVVTLHTPRDPLVPIFHEAMYAETVAAAGNADWLVQRVVDGISELPGYGHCTFTPDEQLDAFVDLVTWVETGVKPAP